MFSVTCLNIAFWWPRGSLNFEFRVWFSRFEHKRTQTSMFCYLLLLMVWWGLFLSLNLSSPKYEFQCTWDQNGSCTSGCTYKAQLCNAVLPVAAITELSFQIPAPIVHRLQCPWARHWTLSGPNWPRQSFAWQQPPIRVWFFCLNRWVRGHCKMS